MIILLLAISLLSSVSYSYSCYSNAYIAGSQSLARDLHAIKELERLQFENFTENMCDAWINHLEPDVAQLKKKLQSLITEKGLHDVHYKAISKHKFNITLHALAENVIAKKSNSSERSEKSALIEKKIEKDELFYLSEASLNYLKENQQKKIMKYIYSVSKKIGMQNPLMGTMLYHWSNASDTIPAAISEKINKVTIQSWHPSMEDSYKSNQNLCYSCSIL